MIGRSQVRPKHASARFVRHAAARRALSLAPLRAKSHCRCTVPRAALSYQHRLRVQLPWLRQGKGANVGGSFALLCAVVWVANKQNSPLGPLDAFCLFEKLRFIMQLASFTAQDWDSAPRWYPAQASGQTKWQARAFWVIVTDTLRCLTSQNSSWRSGCSHVENGSAWAAASARMPRTPIKMRSCSLTRLVLLVAILLVATGPAKGLAG